MVVLRSGDRVIVGHRVLTAITRFARPRCWSRTGRLVVTPATEETGGDQRGSRWRPCSAYLAIPIAVALPALAVFTRDRDARGSAAVKRRQRCLDRELIGRQRLWRRGGRTHRCWSAAPP
jgi:hypothetical protein